MRNFQGLSFYMNTYIYKGCQICISVSLTKSQQKEYVAVNTWTNITSLFHFYTPFLLKNPQVFSYLFTILFLLSPGYRNLVDKAKKLLNVLKKKYYIKKEGFKSAEKVGDFLDVVEKAEKKLKQHHFLTWIAEHV